MYQFFVEPEQINTNDKSVIITGSDVNHIKNVLRMKVGEELSVSNGQDGCEYRCGIVGIDTDSIRCELRFIKEDGVELPVKVTLFQGLPKSDKMETIIQKAVELGAYEIVPVETKRCVVKLDEKKAKAKTVRWRNIAEAAAKQSKRGIIPNVEPPMSFSDALKYASDMEIRLIPYELAQDMEHTRKILSNIRSGQRIALFIGPEGGFETDEIAKAKEAGFHAVTLGKRILRTETAGMTVLAWIGYLLES